MAAQSSKLGGSVLRIRIGCLLATVFTAACGNPVAPPDAALDGGHDGGHLDAGPVCTRGSDCDDGLFCNGPERCEPGNAVATPNGCVAGPAPCASGESCDEDADVCLPSTCPSDPSMRDIDGDGHQLMACAGGDDCDDSDGNRYTGNAEVCDADGHDEDCDESSVGDADADGDGYVSAACCNGTTCGPDCNDSNASVHPGVGEVCNGIDDDCDGAIDVSTSLLCPGGSCTAGRCNYAAWDRTFGGERNDNASAVSMDGLGTVFVGGGVDGMGIDYGAATVVNSMGRDAFLVSYSADGVYRWRAEALDVPGSEGLMDVGVTAGGIVYAIVKLSLLPAPHDFGSGPRETGDELLMAFDASDGRYRWDIVLPAGNSLRDCLAVVEEDVIVAGGAASTSRTAYIWRVHPDGAIGWTRTWSAGDPDIHSIAGKPAVRGDGLVATGFQPGAGGAGTPFLAEFSLADGSTRWMQPIEHNTLSIKQLAVDSTGQIYAVGSFRDTLMLGVSCDPDPASSCTAAVGPGGASSVDGVILEFDAAHALAWIRTFGGSGGDFAQGIAINAADEIFVVGSFTGSTNFGGGIHSISTARAGFMVRYSRTHLHLWDDVFATSGSANAQSEAVAAVIGPADDTVVAGRFTGSVDFGSGTRTSLYADVTFPYQDAFVTRLAN